MLLYYDLQADELILEKRIQVPFNKTVVLVFDQDIVEFDLGSQEVLYKKEKRKVKLKAAVENFEETNLILETYQGKFCLFTLCWHPNPEKIFFSFKLPAVDKASQKKSSSATATHQEDAFYKKCQLVLKTKRDINTIGEILGSVSIELENILADKDLLFFKITINNNSEIRYDIDVIDFVISNKKKKRINQDESLQPIYSLHPGLVSVPAYCSLQQVLVFKKFTFTHKQRLRIEVRELQGGRSLNFILTTKQLLDAKKL